MMDFDPRDRDEDNREIEMPWIELGHGRELDLVSDDGLERDDEPHREAHDRSTDPRDVFLELPREAALQSGRIPRQAVAPLLANGGAQPDSQRHARGDAAHRSQDALGL